jgi:hypothetical protein
MAVRLSQPTTLPRVPPKRRLTFNRLHGVIYQKTELFNTNTVPTSQRTHDVSITNTSWLMVFRETISHYSENHEEDLDTFSRHNAEFRNTKARGTYSNHCSFQRDRVTMWTAELPHSYTRYVYS